MVRLEQRVVKIEQAAAHVDFKAMTDDELRTYVEKLPSLSSERVAAVIALVNRHPSTLPVVYDDPERKSPGCEG